MPGILDFFKKKKAVDNPIKELYKKIFPNGDADTLAGARELKRILGDKIQIEEAKSIFVKTMAISTMGEFSEQRMKMHLKPYALHHFNSEQLSKFYQYLTALVTARMMSNKTVSEVRCENGGYLW